MTLITIICMRKMVEVCMHIGFVPQIGGGKLSGSITALIVICRTLPYCILVIERRLCHCRRLESTESLLEKHVLAKAPDLEARLTLWDQKQVRRCLAIACTGCRHPVASV